MPQPVDPFMPLPPSSPARLQLHAEHEHKKQKPTRKTRNFLSPSKPRVVDGFFRSKTYHSTTKPRIQPPRILVDGHDHKSTPQPTAQQTIVQPKTQQQTILPPPKAVKGARRNVLSKMQAPLILLGAMGVGLLIQSLVMGEILIAAYAIFALVRHIDSRTTFLLALFSLFCIVLLLVIRSDNKLAANFAVYTFLLLAVGTITLGREVHATRS